MSRKPGRDKPRGEVSIYVSYPSENTEPPPRVCTLQNSQEGWLSSLILADLFTYAHTCTTHTPPRRSSHLPSKCVCGIMHWQRQLRPEQKDKQEQTKLPCAAFSAARAQMCCLLFHPLLGTSPAPLNLINWLQKRGHQLLPQVIIQFLGILKCLCLSTAEFGATTAGWKSERSEKNSKNTPKNSSPSLNHRIG